MLCFSIFLEEAFWLILHVHIYEARPLFRQYSRQKNYFFMATTVNNNIISNFSVNFLSINFLHCVYILGELARICMYFTAALQEKNQLHSGGSYSVVDQKLLRGACLNA